MRRELGLEVKLGQKLSLRIKPGLKFCLRITLRHEVGLGQGIWVWGKSLRWELGLALRLEWKLELAVEGKTGEE